MGDEIALVGYPDAHARLDPSFRNGKEVFDRDLLDMRIVTEEVVVKNHNAVGKRLAQLKLTDHESVAQFFNITPNHLSKLFAQHGTMRFIEYVRWVRMAKARMILQKYHLSIHEVAERCGFPDSDYFCQCSPGYCERRDG